MSEANIVIPKSRYDNLMSRLADLSGEAEKRGQDGGKGKAAYARDERSSTEAGREAETGAETRTETGAETEEEEEEEEERESLRRGSEDRSGDESGTQSGEDAAVKRTYESIMNDNSSRLVPPGQRFKEGSYGPLRRRRRGGKAASSSSLPGNKKKKHLPTKPGWISL